MGESNQIQNNNKMILPILLVILIGLVSYFGYTVFLKEDNINKFEEVSLNNSVVRDLYNAFSKSTWGYAWDYDGTVIGEMKNDNKNEMVTASSLLEENKLKIAFSTIPSNKIRTGGWGNLTDEQVAQIIGEKYRPEVHYYIGGLYGLGPRPPANYFSEESLIHQYKIYLVKIHHLNT